MTKKVMLISFITRCRCRYLKFKDSFIPVNDKYQNFIDDNFPGTVNVDNGDVGQDIK